MVRGAISVIAAAFLGIVALRAFLPGSIVAALVALASIASALPPPNEAWVRIRTPHFQMCSNAPSKQVREFAWQLDRFRTVLEGEVQGGRSMTIVVFRDESSFVPYKKQPSGVPRILAGVYLSTNEGDLIGMRGDHPTDPLHIVFHEYVHGFLSRNYLQIPLWYNEGLAEYYSTFRASGDRLEIGLPVEEHVRFLRTKEILPLETLFRIDHSSSEYNEGERRGIFYAQAWALTHYVLLGKPGLRERVIPFLESWSNTPNPQPTCESAFGLPCESLENDFQLYIQDGNYPFWKSKVEDTRAKSAFQIEPMKRSEVLCTLGDYLLHMTPWREDDAQEHFLAALADDSTCARAHSGLARVLEMKQRLSEAERHDRAAIDLDRDDDLLFFRYGMRQLGMTSFVMPGELPAPIERARALFARSLEINPNRAEAYVGMGRTYLADPAEVGAGIEYLEKAHELLPTRMDVLHYLLLLKLRAGDVEEARRLARMVIAHSKDPEIAAKIERAFAADKQRPHPKKSDSQ